MADFVIDASVTLAWLFGEPEQAQWMPARLGEARMVAPWLWRLEVVNAVLIKERRKHISPAQGTRFLHALEALAIEIVGDPAARTLGELALLARPLQLTAYDAVYLDLAQRLALPICSLDRNLQCAARSLGMGLIISPDE